MTLDVPPFAGFGPAAIAWFEGLEQDNSKAYFDAHRQQWEQHVREPLQAMLHDLAQQYGGTVQLFRQHRDIRFSRDKSPYKTNTYGVIHSRPGQFASLYVAISAQGVDAATGYYEMARDQLERYRAAVMDDTSGDALAAVVAQVQAAGVPVAAISPGDVLKTAPRGYPRDHPRADLLRYKSLIASQHLPPDDTLTTPAIRDAVAAIWDAALPLADWLDRYVGDSTTPPAERHRR